MPDTITPSVRRPPFIFVLFPVVYTLALSYPRFRLPIEPLLIFCTSVVLLPLVVRVSAYLPAFPGISFFRESNA